MASAILFDRIFNNSPVLDPTLASAEVVSKTGLSLLPNRGASAPERLEKFGKVWESLEKFGKVWKSLEKFGKVWKNGKIRTGRFGKVWKKFGQVWKSLETFRIVLKTSEKFTKFCKTLVLGWGREIKGAPRNANGAPRISRQGTPSGGSCGGRLPGRACHEREGEVRGRAGRRVPAQSGERTWRGEVERGAGPG